jgi:hypothetical protein
VQSPLPRILAMTREVRESVTGVQASQRQAGETLERLEKASESLAMTTDYLVALAEEDDDEDDEDQDEAQAEDAAVEDIEAGTSSASDQTKADRDDWRSEFDRIEEAWLAGRVVGDAHEALNFLHLVADLHLEELEPCAILAVFDRFRARAGGERFSYCPLHGAVHLVRLRKPSLDNPLVLVRYRELVRLPPCTGLEHCPGVGELLSQARS